MGKRLFAVTKKIMIHGMVLVFIMGALLGITKINTYAASGKCGSAVEWSLAGDILSLTGEGSMSDFTEPDMAPWYAYRNNIKRISVAEGITDIGDLAFYDCDNIESVSLPNTINSLGEYSFAECDNLKQISLGNNVTVLSAHSFDSCRSLKSISLPNSLSRIGYQAFYRCTSLTSITVPKSVYEMDEAVFAYCENLLQANIEAYLLELPEWTFYGCESLNRVSLPATIDEVGSKAFYNCSNLGKMDYNGSEDVKQEILDKIQEDVTDFEAVSDKKDPVQTGSSASSENASNGSTINTNKEVQDTENSTVNVTVQTTTPQVPSSSNRTEVDITIDATIENEAGWEEVIDKVSDYVTYPDRFTDDTTTVNKIQVNIFLKGDITVPSDVLTSLTGSKVNLNITNEDNTSWSVDMEQMVSDNLSKAYDVKYTMTQIDKLDKGQKELVGDVMSFLVEFAQDAPFKVTIKIPLGHSYAGHYATITQKPILKDWEVVQTVVIDGNGDAYFYLDSVDKHTKYMVSIDAEGVDISNALIPDTMADQYGNLTDEFGNKYVITGTKSSLGITFKQLTLIIVGIIVLCAVVVGMIMLMANRAAKKRVAYDLGYQEKEK